MATLNLNSGITVQGTPTQELPEKTAVASTDILNLQSSGTDYYVQASNLLKTYLGYASIRLAAAESMVLDGSNWSAVSFATSGTNGEAYGITADKDNSKLVLTTNGTYKLSFYIPFYYNQLTNILTLTRAGITAGGTLINAYGDARDTPLPSELDTLATGYFTEHRSECVAINIGDITEAGGDRTIPIWGGMQPCYIRDVSLLCSSITGASASAALWDITVVNETQTETLATVDTFVDGDPVAFTTYDLGVSANQAIAKNDVLSLNFTSTGTSPDLSDVTAIVRYSSVGIADSTFLNLGTLAASVDYLCTAAPVDIQLKAYSFGNATVHWSDAGTTLSAVRIT